MKLINESLKIISWNVNGIRSKSMNLINNKKFNEDSHLGLMLKEIVPDILCLCETKCQKEHEEIFKKILPFEFQSWNSSIDKLGYSGVAVLSNLPFKKIDSIPGLELDTQGRYLVLEFDKIFLIYAYVPNSGTNEKYRKEIWDPSIKKFLEKCKKMIKNKDIIYAGDLNVVHDKQDIHSPEIIKKGKNPGVKDFERNMFKYFINLPPNGLGFFDALRLSYNNDDKLFTWWDPRTKGRIKNKGWRLDYFLVSRKKNIKDAKILSQVYGSDHCPIFLEIDIK